MTYVITFTESYSQINVEWRSWWLQSTTIKMLNVVDPLYCKTDDNTKLPISTRLIATWSLDFIWRYRNKINRKLCENGTQVYRDARAKSLLLFMMSFIVKFVMFCAVVPTVIVASPGGERWMTCLDRYFSAIVANRWTEDEQFMPCSPSKTLELSAIGVPMSSLLLKISFWLFVSAASQFRINTVFFIVLQYLATYQSPNNLGSSGDSSPSTSCRLVIISGDVIRLIRFFPSDSTL